ncbi:MAG: type II toxin-antitoxin system PemK/MazF family toxin [Candidatus Omnitrophica bacterium]|nr:type II toxin-antitoxin system PemK/MazF family toxin [Candidatus Omnitrophota bacterium]
MKRSDIFWVNLEPSVGGEVKKTRPAVVVSTDRANPYLNRVVVVPLSSRTEKVYPSEVKVSMEGKEHKAMADQLRVVSKKRMTSKIGVLSSEDMKKIEEKIKLFLELI